MICHEMDLLPKRVFLLNISADAGETGCLCCIFGRQRIWKLCVKVFMSGEDMAIDIPAGSARYYDLLPVPFNDVPFYVAQASSPETSVLELGCGTGRVLVPLADCCGYIHGLDISEAMLSLCRGKLKEARIDADKACVEAADITDFALDRRFDLIIAPYRVFQNLDTDEQVHGFFNCVRAHLSPAGSCILNAFNPWPRDKIVASYSVGDEVSCCEVPCDGGRITWHERRRKMSTSPFVIYPEIIIRRYEDEVLVDEVVWRIPMRCYYPGEFESVVVEHGFEIINRWGGYANEPYGEGPELVIQFVDNKALAD